MNKLGTLFVGNDLRLTLFFVFFGALSNLFAMSSGDGDRLLDAAYSGDLAGVAKLLNQGVDINFQRNGLTALALAAGRGQAPVVNELVRRGANLAEGRPLYRAARYGHETIVNNLLNAGALPDDIGAKGRTPLMTAASHGHLAVVQALVGRGAKKELKDRKGRTARDLALRWRRLEIANFLESPRP